MRDDIEEEKKIVDLDVQNGEEADVLQPDMTWKHYAGHECETPVVAFGPDKPEVVAAAILSCRDMVSSGTHCTITFFSVALRGDGKVMVAISLFVTNQPHSMGPMDRLDRVVLREVVRCLCWRITESQKVILDVLTSEALKAVHDAEAEAFVREVSLIVVSSLAEKFRLAKPSQEK